MSNQHKYYDIYWYFFLVHEWLLFTINVVYDLFNITKGNIIENVIYD
jgi:hypothetical protein